MFKATRAIYEVLQKVDGFKVFTEESDRQSEVWLQFGIKNGGSYRIKFISTDDDNDVAVRVFGFVSVDPGQVGKILPVVNELNCKFRYAKFCCDKDGDVNVEYDFPVSSIRPEESAREIILRVANIIDEAYPLLMRALWA